MHKGVHTGAQDNHLLAFNLAIYSPILKYLLLADSAINLS